jgi:glycosyltransferase involved in cell wall biosynthesis
VPEYADELPVISATTETVYDVLRDLIGNPDKRREIGMRSRQFAVRWHSAEAAAKRFDKIYSDLLAS